MFLERLTDNRPTIGVIGNFDVGKTFFVQQLIRLAKKNGYSHEEYKVDSAAGQAAGESSELQAARDRAGRGRGQPRPKDSDKIGITLHVWVHDFKGTNDHDHFRVIDIPGEFFAEAMKKGALRQIDDVRVAMMYPALAGSDALVLIVPAHDAFGEADDPHPDPIAEDSVHLLGNIRQVCNLLERQVSAANNKLKPAIHTVLGWDADTRRAELDKKTDGRSPKPIVALFSQADRCFGIGSTRNAMGHNDRLPEHDPLACAAQHLPGLVNHLRKGFEDFRVDFLTAAEGQERDDKELHLQRPCIGVWQPIVWLKQRIALRRSVRAQGRLAGLLRRALMLGALDDCERNSGWAIETRMKADKQFRGWLDV